MNENPEALLEVTLDEPVRRDPEVLRAMADDDLVLFHPDRGLYFTTEGVGSRIWELLEEETTGEAICGRLLEEYEVDEAECTRDVRTFLARLAGERLLLRGGDQPHT